MRRYDDLIAAIEDGNAQKASSLVEELYNDLRDFSQCIVEGDDPEGLKINLGSGTAQYRREIKAKIREWVGGY